MPDSSRFDLYEVLCIGRSASTSEIKSAYRRLALLHHPDVNDSSPEASARFKVIHNAYEVLSDPVSRGDYDAFLRASTAKRSDPGPSHRDPIDTRGPRIPSAAQTLETILSHLNSVLWDIEDIVRSGTEPTRHCGKILLRDYVLMMLTFVDRWVLDAAGFPDYFFEARRIRPGARRGGVARLPHDETFLHHHPYVDVEDYFYNIRRRLDRFIGKARLVDLFGAVPGTPVSVIDCILEAHNYCCHYLGWIGRAQEENVEEIPPFGHSAPCFEQ